MSMRTFDQVIDSLQAGMIYFTILLTSLCVLALMLFDVLAGAGVMMYLTNKNMPASTFISLATTGLLLSLMIAATKVKDNKVILAVAGSIYILDIIFDSLGADYIRFGAVIDPSAVAQPWLQWLFRMLIGGISSVGDGIAFAIIIGMPVIKDILRNALPKGVSFPQGSQQRPNQGGMNQQPSYGQQRTATQSMSFNGQSKPQNKPMPLGRSGAHVQAPKPSTASYVNLAESDDDDEEDEDPGVSLRRHMGMSR